MKNASRNKDKLLEIRKITVCRKVFSYHNYHPIITICGKWLKKSRFRAGDKLALKVYEKENYRRNRDAERRILQGKPLGY
ncbi:hypothetical protein [Elizabethkingia anophelis]|uniref:Toxin SymE-like domain-containing protein n=1 Tax=Elizabethkingia anophelis TaxID=1117645 RepID=A0A7Z7PUQ9_9FLAO|nr:hypothetical protein [Elizabethkingia anophelis]MCT3631282.1 hypothetical protein [Elizabethkingia anophelis]MCT3634927.1 hypothetical protein [Elizabethkingia anophelis]MCT3831523.1 hypothetical protein [Elizabethkingia anophelis]MCT3885001.1 hypothetical protein [Elizabethkingia anophelis]MCT3895898.1 hypothetical protein [Elizabethkingia anophelis]